MWRPGLLCIGDAAHAMSPVGGVGINLAIQDAVAAANLLAGPLAAGKLELDTTRWSSDPSASARSGPLGMARIVRIDGATRLAVNRRSQS